MRLASSAKPGCASTLGVMGAGGALEGKASLTVASAPGTWAVGAPIGAVVDGGSCTAEIVGTLAGARDGNVAAGAGVVEGAGSVVLGDVAGVVPNGTSATGAEAVGAGVV